MITSTLNLQQQSNTSFIAPDATIAEALEFSGFGQASAVAVSTDPSRYDIPDTAPAILTENLADWLLDNTQMLDVSNVRALVAIDDSSCASFIRAYEYLGMVKDTHYREVSGDLSLKRIGVKVVARIAHCRNRLMHHDIAMP